MLIDWLWWGFGGVFTAVGLLVLVRALFADRSRGRKRCPKCWYDLTGLSGLRCPECGRVAKGERSLYRTRRRWKVAAGGALVLILGLGCFAGREIHQHGGWIEATPTWVYIALLPHLDVDTTFDELYSRVATGELRQWEYRALARRSLGTLKRVETEVDVLVATMRIELAPNGWARGNGGGWCFLPRNLGVHPSWHERRTVNRSNAMRSSS